MYRILQATRLLPSSILIRLNSTNKIPVRNLQNNDEDDDDDIDNSKKLMSPKDYIFADSKSSRFKEKNNRKQKLWLKELAQRKIVPNTPLSTFLENPKTRSENVKENVKENKVIRYG